MRKRFLCLWLDNWPIQRLVVERPELRRQAVVLYATVPGRGQRVTALSPTARQAGVRSEMPLSEARSLLARNPQRTRRAEPSSAPPNTAPPATQTYFLPHDPAADQAQLQQLACACESYSPYLGVEALPESPLHSPAQPTVLGNSGCPRTPPDRPECLLLEVQSVAHLFGGEAGMWATVQRDFQQRGYCVQAAIADTLGAARAAARYLAPRWTTESPRPIDPADAVRIESAPGEIPTPLRSFPLAALRLHPLAIDLLRQLGVERIEQLLAIPRGDLRARFGAALLLRLDQFSGRVEEVIPWLHAPAEFHAQQFLDFPTTDCTTIEVILGHLVEALCRQLHAAGRGGLRWAIHLDSPDAPPQRFSLPLLQATALPRQVLPLIRIKLDQMGLAPPGRGRSARHGRAPRQDFSRAAFCVHHLSVRVCESVVLAERQRLLFDESPRIRPGELADLIERLSTRWGPDQVVQAKLQAEGQAELAFRYEPLVGTNPSPPSSQPPARRNASTRRTLTRRPSTRRPSTRRARSNPVQETGTPSELVAATSPAAYNPLARPLRLFPPEEIQVVVAAGLAGVAGPSESHSVPHRNEPPHREEPRQIVWRQRTWAVHRCWGAERIETGWWRGPTIRRDYWRIELADGRWLWIYFDLACRQWFLHGAF